jgi:hypothetical protein
MILYTFGQTGVFMSDTPLLDALRDIAAAFDAYDVKEPAREVTFNDPDFLITTALQNEMTHVPRHTGTGDEFMVFGITVRFIRRVFQGSDRAALMEAQHRLVGVADVLARALGHK